MHGTLPKLNFIELAKECSRFPMDYWALVSP
jgi:hypothetical protein